MPRKRKIRIIIAMISIAIIGVLAYQIFVIYPQRKQIREYGFRAVELTNTSYVLPDEYIASDKQIPEEVVDSMVESFEKEYSKLFSSRNPKYKSDLEINERLIQQQIDGKVIIYYTTVELIESRKINFNHNNTANYEFVVLISFSTEEEVDGSMRKYENEVKWRYTVSFVKEDGLWKVYSIDYNFA